MFLLSNDWNELLEDQLEKEYFLKLKNFLKEEYSSKKIYPKKELVFNALNSTSYKETKVVILGQDPYHGPGQANGLSFSVNKGVKIPPSLKNIFKELGNDLALSLPNHGCLDQWAKQGVLLLNTTLTVEAAQPNSHQGKGWESFTDQIISLLNEKEQPVVFILWGRNAQKKMKLITSNHHLIIGAPHPSPLSANRGFFGSKPFSKVNDFLKSVGMREINWKINHL